jgi:hypothetical protein
LAPPRPPWPLTCPHSQCICTGACGRCGPIPPSCLRRDAASGEQKVSQVSRAAYFKDKIRRLPCEVFGVLVSEASEEVQPFRGGLVTGPCRLRRETLCALACWPWSVKWQSRLA